MELQLGLAPPGGAVKGFDFDLNTYVYGTKEISGSTSSNAPPFASVPPNRSCSTNHPCFCCDKSIHRKRSFDEAFEVSRFEPRYKDDDSDDNGDRPKDLDYSSSVASNKIVGRDEVVGWPPVKTRRKKPSCQYHSRRLTRDDQTAETSCRCSCCRQYVKVKMDGVAIARKIDLSLHNSFQTLMASLASMFGIYHGNHSCYKLTYQDRDGDWLIAEDVSWGTFIRTVQRLKLSKTKSNG